MYKIIDFNRLRRTRGSNMYGKQWEPETFVEEIDRDDQGEW